MTLSSSNLALALTGAVLLLVPAPQWYGRRVSYRTLEYLEVARRNAGWWVLWRRLLRMPQHWIELARGALGTALGLMAVRAWREVPGFAEKPPMWLRDETVVVVAALGLALMLVRFRKADGLLAPVVFVSGVTAVAAPPLIAAMTLILAFTVMAATRLLGMFFAILAFSLIGLGYFLAKNLVGVGALAGFAFLPVAVGLLRSRELVLPVRRSRGEISETR